MTVYHPRNLTGNLEYALNEIWISPGGGLINIERLFSDLNESGFSKDKEKPWAKDFYVWKMEFCTPGDGGIHEPRLYINISNMLDARPHVERFNHYLGKSQSTE